MPIRRILHFKPATRRSADPPTPLPTVCLGVRGQVRLNSPTLASAITWRIRRNSLTSGATRHRALSGSASTAPGIAHPLPTPVSPRGVMPIRLTAPPPTAPHCLPPGIQPRVFTLS